MTPQESETITKIITKSWLAVIGIFTFFATAVGGYVLQGKSVSDNAIINERQEIAIRANADKLTGHHVKLLMNPKDSIRVAAETARVFHGLARVYM